MKTCLLLLLALTLAGCDRLTGVADQKNHDAEAIGYACRVSKKAPQECMKDNEAHSPSAILAGWKSADKDIQNNVIDPAMNGVKNHSKESDNEDSVAEDHPAGSAVVATPKQSETKKPESKDSEHPKKSEP